MSHCCSVYGSEFEIEDINCKKYTSCKSYGMKAIVPHENFVAPGVCLYPLQDLRNAQVLSKLLATVDPDPGHLTRKENIDYFHLEYLPKTIHTWMLSSGRLHLFVKYFFLVINQF